MALLTGVALSTPATETKASTPNPDRGLYIYQAYCVGCHGQSGRGDGPMAGKLFRDFGIRPTDLGATDWLRGKDDVVLAQAIKGSNGYHRRAYMPAWSETLNDKQVDDLVAYVRGFEAYKTETEAPITNIGDHVELGRVLYSIHCLACHGPRGEGDGPFFEGLIKSGDTLAVMPSFREDDFFFTRSDQDIENVVRKGTGHSGLMPKYEQGWWDQAIEERELRALIFYLRTLPLTERRKKM